MKRLVGITIAIVLFLGVITLPATAQASDVKVEVNGSLLAFDQPPVIENGRTLVPFRVIFEALSMTVDYKEENGRQIVTAQQGEKNIRLIIGADEFYLNETPVPLDVPAKIINSRTLIPVRAIAESLDANVNWDDETRTVLITTDGTRLIKSRNLVNPAALSVGYVSKKTGEVIGTADIWRTSDYLPVQPGETVVSENERSGMIEIQFLAAYDENKQVIPSAGITRGGDGNGTTYIVPEGVNYIRLSVATNQAGNVDQGGWMVAIMRHDEAGIPFERWGVSVADQWKVSDQESSEHPSALSISEKVFPNDGGNSLQADKEVLPVGTHLKLDLFPQNLKKGLEITFSAKFDEFKGLTVGKGYDHARGDWLVIDNEAVTWKGFGASRDGMPKTHGLTIQNDIRVTIRVGGGKSGVCNCTLQSGEQKKVLEFAWFNEQNGIPFALGEQEMTDVHLCAVATDMECPVWVFGDSYFGSADNRVIGQLFRLGYGENCLINGQAGQRSDNGYEDFEKLLQLGGMPQKLVWMLGMNDAADGYQEAVQQLSALAEEYDFELILMTVPIVPNKVSPGLIDEYVRSSGYRYVDACSAVGADEDGNWYEGYLSEDGIHPTASGARAIAEQLILDVPEITVE